MYKPHPQLDSHTKTGYGLAVVRGEADNVLLKHVRSLSITRL